MFDRILNMSMSRQLLNTIRTLTYSALCFFQVYAGIVNYIHQTLLRHIQAYSAKFSTLYNPRIVVTLPYSEPWHI